MQQWFNAKRDEGSKSASIRIYDQIGDSWFGDSTSAKGFVEAVDELGDDLDTLNVHINSPGGNVYDGLAIYNYLKRHQADVVGYVDGIAASIASIIAMAGDRIVMPENSAMFIHNPWTFAGGDAAALRKTADELDTMRGSLLGIYMSRAKDLSEDEVVAMMDAETLMTAEEAVLWGFADELEAASKMAASVNSTGTLALARAAAEHEMTVLSLQAQLRDANDRFDSANTTAVNLSIQLDEMQEELSDMRSSMLDMEPIEEALLAEETILEVENASGPEWLATHCIKQGMGAKNVHAAITRYQGVRDACVAAGIERPDDICRDHFGDTAALVSALLVEALASADEGISNRLGVEGGDGRPAPTINYGKAYASRKPKSH